MTIGSTGGRPAVKIKGSDRSCRENFRKGRIWQTDAYGRRCRHACGLARSGNRSCRACKAICLQGAPTEVEHVETRITSGLD